MKCSICGTDADSVDTAIEEGWTPYFFDGQVEQGPACADCSGKYLVGSGGEMQVRPKFRSMVCRREAKHIFEDLVFNQN